MSSPTFQPGQNLYSANSGLTNGSQNLLHIDVRAPTTTDVIYQIGTNWLDKVLGNYYVLTSFTSSAGVLTANWAFLGGSSGDLNTLTTDDLTVVAPSAGNINLSGSGSLTTTGAGHTATVSLTGLTNHNVLIGAGTATITKVAPSATSGVALISQGAAADPAFGTVIVAGGGTGATTLTGVLTGNGTSAVTANTVTNHGVLIGGASNAVSSLSVASTGSVLAGVTGADPAFHAITELNIVDNTTGTVGAPTTVVVSTTYIADEASVTTGFVLPASGALGDTFRIIGNGPGGWQLQQNANQSIKLGSSTTTTGTSGSLSSTSSHDCVTLVCTVAGASTTWVVASFAGTLTLV